MVVQKESEGAKTFQLLKKVAELEQLVGKKKQVEVEYLKKVIEFGSELSETDIKKNSNPSLDLVWVIDMGITRFEFLISSSGLEIERKKLWIKTTNSNHNYYKFLVTFILKAF